MARRLGQRLGGLCALRGPRARKWINSGLSYAAGMRRRAPRIRAEIRSIMRAGRPGGTACTTGQLPCYSVGDTRFCLRGCRYGRGARREHRHHPPSGRASLQNVWQNNVSYGDFSLPTLLSQNPREIYLKSV